MVLSRSSRNVHYGSRTSAARSIVITRPASRVGVGGVSTSREVHDEAAQRVSRTRS